MVNTPLPTGDSKRFKFENHVIFTQKNSTSFLLQVEKGKYETVTFYKIVKLLSPEHFKSYAKQIKPLNGKIKILPYSERYRAIFYFRNRVRSPPILENADTIAAFINTAITHTDNIQLKQNWSACLDVTDGKQDAAASLFVHYGWSPDFGAELPRTESAFYTVDLEDGTRSYKIVEDDITKRFDAIKAASYRPIIRNIIENPRLSKKEQENQMQAEFMPRLWWRDGIRMSLTTEARIECQTRISDFIERLLCFNTFDGIPLEEHINRVDIDRTDPGFLWAAPQEFSLSIEDFAFSDYKYNIDADMNRANAAELGTARSRAAAERNFENVMGDEWTAQELYAQGIDKDKIPRLVKNGLIEHTGRGRYRRVSS